MAARVERLARKLRYLSFYAGDYTLRGLGIEDGLRRRFDEAHKNIRRGQRRRARAAERFFDLLGVINRKAGRAIRRGAIAGGRKVRTAAKATRKAIDRMRTVANFGAVAEDRNKRLKGFTFSANEYDQFRAKGREEHMARVRELDSQSPLGIKANPHIAKIHQAGGAVVANHHRQQAALQNQANAIMARNRRIRKNKRKAAEIVLRDSIELKGLADIARNLSKMTAAPMSSTYLKIAEVIEAALERNTPKRTGRTARAIRKEVSEAQGEVFYDPAEAPHALHLDAGTKDISPRLMRYKAIQQSKKECFEAGVKAYKKTLGT